LIFDLASINPSKIPFPASPLEMVFLGARPCHATPAIALRQQAAAAAAVELFYPI
jgi:hypothetical protein